MLCGRPLRGGSRWGKGGSGCGGCGVLACVWVRVWIKAGPPLLPWRLLSFVGLCGVVLVLLVMLLLVVVVVVLLLQVLSLGFRLWFGVRFWVGVRFEVGEDFVPEV